MPLKLENISQANQSAIALRAADWLPAALDFDLPISLQ